MKENSCNFQNTAYIPLTVFFEQLNQWNKIVRHIYLEFSGTASLDLNIPEF